MKAKSLRFYPAILLFISSLSQANDGVEVQAAGANFAAISIFIAFVCLTLLITVWAAKRTKSREAFYAASGGITPVQNAFAIAGDFMSAATLLGITGLMFSVGYDGYILSFAIIIGWGIMLILIAERFRNLGKFTFVDVATYRLKSNGIQLFLPICSLIVVLFYLMGQMVGAGKLIELLFGLDYNLAVVIVAVLMVFYVTVGGMLATTWVQMIKAFLLLFGGGFIAFELLRMFGFSFDDMLASSISVHDRGDAIIKPGGWLKLDFWHVTSVGLTMCFGIMGLPHILMRFFTVKDAKGARKSVAYATIIMAIFYLFILVIGLGSIAILWNNPEYYTAEGKLIGGSNMVALHSAKILGGDFMLGFMSAVAFATILAVVAGLTLSGAAAVAHDIYGNVIKKGKSDPKKELLLSRVTVLIIGVISIFLAMAFESQNIAVIVAFALSLAASVNFPLLVYSMYWRGLTSRGAVVGGTITLIVTLVCIVLSDSVWVKVLGNPEPLFNYVYPTVISMPCGFILMWLFSVTDKSETSVKERSGFGNQYIQSEIGLDVSAPSDH